MKNLLAALVVSLFVVSAPIPADEACPLVETHGHGRLLDGALSPFWAQDYVGASLARESLTRYREAGGAVLPPRLGVLDADLAPSLLSGPATARFRRQAAESEWGSNADCAHGTLVTNLINGKAPVGVGTAALEAFFQKRHDGDDDPIVAAMGREDVRLVNASLKWDRERVTPGLGDLSDRAIVVFAAGNSYSHPVPRFAGAPRVIGVGSLHPAGFLSSYTQEGDGVDIMAPAEYPLVTSHCQAYEGFGATSGAAPIVTGALSNVLAVLSDLAPDEARKLLERTAVPTVNTRQVPRRNGAGMVNALKLVEVALRLKAEGWPARREQLVQAGATYDFSTRAARLLAEGEASLASGACSRRREGLRQVRAALLLAAGNDDAVSRATFEKARAAHIQVLEAERLSVDAGFYRSFDQDGLARMLEERIPGEPLEGLRAIGRTLELIPLEKAHALLARAVTVSDVPAALNAVLALSYFPAGGPIAPIAYRHPDVRVRREIIRVTRRGTGNDALLRQALGDPDAEVRETAAARLAGRPK